MNPLLGRWISADPLAVHAPGSADLNVYAYVSGQVLKNIDPLGLERQETDAQRQEVEVLGQQAEEIGQLYADAADDVANTKSYLENAGDPQTQEEAQSIEQAEKFLQSRTADMQDYAALRDAKLAEYNAAASKLKTMETSDRANEKALANIEANEKQGQLASTRPERDWDLRKLQKAEKVAWGVAAAGTAGVGLAVGGAAALTAIGLEGTVAGGTAQMATVWGTTMGFSSFGAGAGSLIGQSISGGEISYAQAAASQGLGALTGFGLAGPLAVVGGSGAIGFGFGVAGGTLEGMVTDLPSSSPATGTSGVVGAGQAAAGSGLDANSPAVEKAVKVLVQ